MSYIAAAAFLVGNLHAKFVASTLVGEGIQKKHAKGTKALYRSSAINPKPSIRVRPTRPKLERQ